MRLTVSMPNLGFLKTDLKSAWVCHHEILPLFCFLMTCRSCFICFLVGAFFSRWDLVPFTLASPNCVVLFDLFLAEARPFVNLSTIRSRSNWYTANVTNRTKVSTGLGFKANKFGMSSAIISMPLSLAVS